MTAPKRLIPVPESLATRGADSRVLSRDEAQAIIARALKFSRAGSIKVTVDSSYTGNTRFAANQMTTSGGVVNANVAVESAFGPKHAAVTTNDLSDQALRRTVEQSEVLARLAPDDPESMPPLGPQEIANVDARFESTASLSAEDRARAALTALAPARSSRDLAAAGFIVTAEASQALGNNTGLSAYHRWTTANYTLTVRTADGTGSGWAGADHPDWSKLDIESVSTRSIEKARLSRSPVAIEPGRYTVILEPQAVADLVQLVAFYADARASDEGRSPFVKQGGGGATRSARKSWIAESRSSRILAIPSSWPSRSTAMGSRSADRSGSRMESSNSSTTHASGRKSRGRSLRARRAR